MLLALAAAYRLRDYEFFRHIKADLFLDNFPQGDVRHAGVTNLTYKRPAHRAATGIELPHATRDQVDQNVGVANLHQSLLAQFAIQESKLVELIEPDTIGV